MFLPPSDPDLVRRLGALETACLRRRMAATCTDGDNPLGTIIEEHGPATVFAALNAPEAGFFNTVHGLQPSQAGELDTIFATPRRHGIRLRALALPGSLDAALASALIDAGLRPESWWSILYREATAVPVVCPPGVTIARATADDAVSFAEVCCAGFGIGHDDPAGAVRAISRWVTDIPDFSCYLARYEGRPAAIGVLYCEGGLGYLAAAATHPDCRGQGCQTALIAQRVHDAAAAGCELAVVHTSYASTSQRNQERAGFRLAATCQTWTAPRPDSPAGSDV